MPGPGSQLEGTPDFIHSCFTKLVVLVDPENSREDLGHVTGR